MPQSAEVTVRSGSHSLRRIGWIGALLVAAGLCALAIDLPVARSLLRDHALRGLHGVLGALEPFGQPAAVVLVAVAIWLCDATRRVGVPRLLAASLGAGLGANVIKLCLSRLRPNHSDLDGSILETFQGLLPGISAGARGQSFPSAHTAVAVGFCLALSARFPRARWMFVTAATMVALQRVEAGAHFISDTCWGAATACGLWLILHHPRLLGSWFDRREAEWQQRAFQKEGLSLHDAVEPALSRQRVPAAEDVTPESGAPAVLSLHRDWPQTLSVVVPVFDEQDNLVPLHAGLRKTLDELGEPFEILYVDDGSCDRSAAVLAELVASDVSVRVVTLQRNCGQSVALLAGIQQAQGEVLVLLDADLQNDPADIPALVAQLNAGYDLVHGWRKHRQDRWLDRKLPSALANRLISWVTGQAVHDTGCTLKVMRREVAQGLPLFGGLHRFIPALARARGAHCLEWPVQHHPRRSGSSKYGLSRVFRVLADLLLVKFVTQSLRQHQAALNELTRAKVSGEGGLAAPAKERIRRAS